MKRSREFVLEVAPRPKGEYGLVLSEVLAPERRGGQERQARQIVWLWGQPMRAVFDRVVEAVKSTGARASDIRRDRRAPFHLDEEAAVRLGLLFLAVKPLKKTTRIDAIRDATAVMASEEVYYWFAKCAAPESGRRAERALRVLLAQE